MYTIFSLSSHLLMDSQDHFIMTLLLQMVSQMFLWYIDLEYFIHTLTNGVAGLYARHFFLTLYTNSHGIHIVISV